MKDYYVQKTKEGYLVVKGFILSKEFNKVKQYVKKNKIKLSSDEWTKISFEGFDGIKEEDL